MRNLAVPIYVSEFKSMTFYGTSDCKDSSHPEKLANTDDFLILAASTAPSGGCTAAPSAIGDDFFVHVEQDVQVLVGRVNQIGLPCRRRFVCQTAIRVCQAFITREGEQATALPKNELLKGNVNI